MTYNTAYVHGYSNREALRLNNHADTLDDLLHHDTRFPAGSLILEAGCGVVAHNWFDDIVICFVLEHFYQPKQALDELKRVLTGGILMAIEVDHGSTFFYPDSPEAHAAINCQVQLQR